MSIFNQLQQKLSEQLQNSSFQGEIQCLQVEIACSETLPLLSWLKHQSLFPHFYWQDRENGEITIGIGALREFKQLEQAQQFSHHHRLPLLGGIQFEGNAHFILPRLLLVKKAQHLTACLFIEHIDTLTEQLLTDLIHCAEHSNHTSFQELAHQKLCDFQHWQNNIHHALDAINAKQFRKVVLANALRLDFAQSLCPYSLLSRSLTTNLGCYHFLWAENPNYTFIGSSPERLYQRNGAQLYTEALAGTTAVSHDPIQTEKNAKWLLNDSKNIFENQLVVEDIYQHLQDCLEEFEVGEREIKRLHNVQHLRRRIQAKTRTGITDCEILNRLHPTAAIAGLPRQNALSFIQQHENFKRGWYAGTLGYFTPEQAEFCVTLRSALIQNNHITCYAGAGIVQGSDAESEWQEIARKSLAMRLLLKE